MVVWITVYLLKNNLNREKLDGILIVDRERR